MNKESQSPNPEHGTMQSYVIGFVLSIIFTLIPYYLVVNKTFAGSGLQSVVLGFAVLQMLVQIFFFLHLGRGPKPFYNVVFFASTVGIILVVIGGSVFIMNNLHYNMSPEAVTKKLSQEESIAQIGDIRTGACQVSYTNHQFTIKNGEISPAHIEAELCDSLTFINKDDKVREIGFGFHPNHDGYAGQDDLLVYKGRPKTITLNQTGEFLFHDHLDPGAVGTFTVSK